MTTAGDRSEQQAQDAGAALEVAFTDDALETAKGVEGALVVFFRSEDDAQTIPLPAAAAADAATSGQVAKALKSAKGERGEIIVLTAPAGIAADHLLLVGLGEDKLTAGRARRVGGRIARRLGALKAEKATLRLDGAAEALGGLDAAALAAETALGLRLRAYRFDARKSEPTEKPFAEVAIGGVAAEAAKAADAAGAGLAAGVALTRDLVNEPANILTPPEFVERARALAADGLEVEVLDEAALDALGMRALLAVGRGSRQPSAVVTLKWTGADEPAAPPLCLVGKGVCFDTGGISLKPPAGMEEMTMDMGGAGVVAGAMKAIARRKSKANVVGLLGLVENMPDGDAQRPGDIVTAMSGKTVEVINTDAEGRLVLADVLWHAQKVHQPRAIIDLATLTGAMIIALGHEKAGFFANDDALAEALTAAADQAGEGIWRLPLGPAYDKALKSRLADMKNVGGRPAGSITAAQFLQRFIEDGQAWAHIDIAGVTITKDENDLWPKGPSGWGVATLVRLAEEMFAPPAEG